MKLFILVLTISAVAYGQNSLIPWSSLDMGFGISTSSTTQVISIAGQGFTGSSENGSTSVLGGFLPGVDSSHTATSVAEQPRNLPQQFELEQNYPNPFNPSTHIRFAIVERAATTLKVYNILGEEVRTLVNGDLAQGDYDVVFDAAGLASGVYLYRLQSGTSVRVRKLMVLR
jgi:Secretion system C-terminal sorting domain